MLSYASFAAPCFYVVNVHGITPSAHRCRVLYIFIHTYIHTYIHAFICLFQSTLLLLGKCARERSCQRIGGVSHNAYTHTYMHLCKRYVVKFTRAVPASALVLCCIMHTHIHTCMYVSLLKPLNVMWSNSRGSVPVSTLVLCRLSDVFMAWLHMCMYMCLIVCMCGICIYIYICLYVYMCVYVYAYVHLYTNKYLMTSWPGGAYVCICYDMYVYVDASCSSVAIPKCICLCEYVVYMYVHLHLTHFSLYTFECAHALAHTWHVHMNVNTSHRRRRIHDRQTARPRSADGVHS